MSLNVFSQRVVQASSRRLATTNPSIMSKALRMTSPASIAMGQVRYAASSPSSNTTIISQSEGTELLAKQRRLRPVAPHLTIYRPQITWYGSAANRVTGLMMSGPFYIFGLLYLVAPYVGLHMESASLAAAFAAWPIAAKIATKFTFAMPFVYHSMNGLRHLMWDTGAGFTNKQVIVTGWTVVGLSVLTALGLTVY